MDEAVAVAEVEEVAVTEVVAAVVTQEKTANKHGQRKRTFSISTNTWTRRLLSSSVEAEKVHNIISFHLPTSSASLAESEDIQTIKSAANKSPSTVTGTLKGYDQLMNLVLDDVREHTRGEHPIESLPNPTLPLTEIRFLDEEGNTSTRPLGLLVARGTLLVLISPVDGSEEIANPFVQAEGDE